ncbi:MAG: Efflux ABC transporter, ATP-binding protein [uncultured Thermomicrobiales bacterium]|uniref:Efflux ABC transporter, ATP-binding protein n=1 Tax=uncultured Thermomicrobiales bacterium TaxID=1645740 RepID=A0A6J4U2N3_9BACT|nr:MAG: Efflux ABC transporter, ATP-binding protein [uncultured Thermomicrobiales bacterium]
MATATDAAAAIARPTAAPRPAERPPTAAAVEPPMVEVHDLRKEYGQVRAVAGISFAVAPGEVFGLLGHNGAGKTTTIRMLTGRTRPTGGKAIIAGHDVAVARDAVKPLINLVFEDQNLYERFSGRENLRIFTDLYGTPRSRADELLEEVNLVEAGKRKVKTYSTGMKQRLLVARALINRPKVLFLDEPTRGLDPTSARDLRALITRLSAGGTTVFLTTHYMEEADELCHRVAFLSQGQLVALDTPRELKLRYGQRTATVLTRDRREHRIRLDDRDDAARLASWMADDQILTLHSHEGTLEDVFVALAGRPL